MARNGNRKCPNCKHYFCAHRSEIDKLGVCRVPGCACIGVIRPPTDPCMTLRIKERTDRKTIVIRVWKDGRDSAGRAKLTVEVRQGGEVIFPYGQLYCAVHGSSDGIRAKELVLALVGMRPGDTDADYFDGYTPEQIAWAEEHADDISLARSMRYCDPETGTCMRSEREARTVREQYNHKHKG